MNILIRYTRPLMLCLLAAALLAPELSWAHGTTGYPISRAANCKVTGGHWSGTVNDKGCADAAAIHSNDAEKAYPVDHFHEFAINTWSATTPIDQILAQLKPGMVCSANDSNKRSMDVPTPDWKKTHLQPGTTVDIQLLMTAVHVPSRAFVYITKPGFNSATTAVSTSDLIPLGGVHTLTTTKPDWQNLQPPVSSILGTGGYVLLPTPIPGGLTGSAVIVVIWARDDGPGETFVNCSDVSFDNPGNPGNPTANDLGPTLDPGTQIAKPGDTIRHRVISKGVDVSDVKILLTPTNLPPGMWMTELRQKITTPGLEIGEMLNNKIIYNTVDPGANHTWFTDKDAQQVTSVLAGGGPAPTPTPRITGPIQMMSGQTYTFTGELINAQNTVLYSWAPVVQTQNTSSKTVSGPAPMVAQPTKFTVRLNTRDGPTGPNYVATFDTTVVPPNSGGNPPYVEGSSYNAGDKVSHNGKNYECKPWPFSGWCGAKGYEPGHANGNWVNAWIEL